jgi:hypothetical protein
VAFFDGGAVNFIYSVLSNLKCSMQSQWERMLEVKVSGLGPGAWVCLIHDRQGHPGSQETTTKGEPCMSFSDVFHLSIILGTLI